LIVILAALGMSQELAQVISTPDAAEGTAAIGPLSNAHSHNDYERPRPLLDALANGFCSVEADVHLVNDALLVAHERSEIRPDLTLERLYLRPLQERTRRNGGSIYPGNPRFWLLIDLKSDAEPTYARVHKALAEAKDIVSEFRAGKATWRAVTAVISGNRPRGVMQKQDLRYALYDGRLSDLEPAPGMGDPIIGWISDSWKSHFTWTGDGPFPALEREKLMQIVARSHEWGWKVRFWGTPDRAAFWSELQGAGVDILNADDLPALRQFLERRNRR
jgi:hypothetical protein